ncbi:hypothetical protein CANTEDRAFT_105095 [Yamadazyma tenuis ATCC 10573]|uniref:Galactose oxidase n=3 Tax=Candida tenuis TaxID=2315449 RepID=G3B475_CANTC|nr:uncharacterized protein CANTEDRAFT_105095 [Yamadazyma tenuis ATCC 10573]EGV63794.1 hypothetical protein CANTEDRAFT_105095 [Yamadazyma tenuis ATCC 10573]
MLAQVLTVLLVVQATLAINSQALYAITKNLIYLSLDNEDLVAINFSISGDSDTDTSQSLRLLASPPSGSSLFLVKDELFGMTGDNEGDLSLSKYNGDEDEWDTIKLNSTQITDNQFYNSSSYLTSFDSDQIYIYGGINADDEVSDRLLSLDFNTFVLSNISTTTKPESFYGASNLIAPDSSTQLLIAGKSSQGWLNMFQLATWNFESGWSFKTVAKGGNSINSRQQPLVLPIFNKLDNNSLSTVVNYYHVSKVLVIGGEQNGKSSSPEIAYLDVSENDWTYSVPTIDNSVFNADDYIGIVTVFENIITISKSSSKRDGQYEVNYFDLNFEKASKINVPSDPAKSSKEESASIQQKAILGTVIPIGALICIVAGGYFFMKKRKAQKLERELKDLNYHFENNYKVEGTHNALFNDSHSTLDVDSIDSWVRKRQEFDRNQHMQSQETLTRENSIVDYFNIKERDDEDEDENSFVSTPQPLKTLSKLNKRVVRLKKSISFNSLPSPERRANLLNDDEARIDIITPTKTRTRNLSPVRSPIKTRSSIDSAKVKPVEEPNVFDDYEFASEEKSIDDFDVDVQVLVSSKRRSTLKVVNPDVSSSRSDSIRYRTPSNDSINEDL